MGLTVLMGHIYCRHCYIHISEVMGKLNIACCIHIDSYSDFFFFITVSSFGFIEHL